jgi:hypothetical protein
MAVSINTSDEELTSLIITLSKDIYHALAYYFAINDD